MLKVQPWHGQDSDAQSRAGACLKLVNGEDPQLDLTISPTLNPVTGSGAFSSQDPISHKTLMFLGFPPAPHSPEGLVCSLQHLSCRSRPGCSDARTDTAFTFKSHRASARTPRCMGTLWVLGCFSLGLGPQSGGPTCPSRLRCAALFLSLLARDLDVTCLHVKCFSFSYSFKEEKRIKKNLFPGFLAVYNDSS